MRIYFDMCGVQYLLWYVLCAIFVVLCGVCSICCAMCGVRIYCAICGVQHVVLSVQPAYSLLSITITGTASAL